MAHLAVENPVGIDADASVHTAAFAIVGPIERLHGRYFEEDLVGQVVSTANRIEVELTER